MESPEENDKDAEALTISMTVNEEDLNAIIEKSLRRNCKILTIAALAVIFLSWIIVSFASSWSLTLSLLIWIPNIMFWGAFISHAGIAIFASKASIIKSYAFGLALNSDNPMMSEIKEKLKNDQFNSILIHRSAIFLTFPAVAYFGNFLLQCNWHSVDNSKLVIIVFCFLFSLFFASLNCFFGFKFNCSPDIFFLIKNFQAQRILKKNHIALKKGSKIIDLDARGKNSENSKDDDEKES